MCVNHAERSNSGILFVTASTLNYGRQVGFYFLLQVVIERTKFGYQIMLRLFLRGTAVALYRLLKRAEFLRTCPRHTKLPHLSSDADCKTNDTSKFNRRKKS